MNLTKTELETLPPNELFGYYCEYQIREWLREFVDYHGNIRGTNNEDYADAFRLFQKIGTDGVIEYLLKQGE